jgi:Flp pilus assembly protein TadB
MIYLILIGSGIFLIVFLTLQGIFNFLQRVKPGERINELLYILDNLIRNSPKILGFRLSIPYVLAAAGLSVLGIIFGLAWLHNTIATVLLFVFGLAFPQLIMLQVVSHRQERIVEQLGMAVRIFAAEYNDTPHTLRAIGKTGERLPEPIGSIFRHAEQEFLVGENPEQVLRRMSKRIGTDYGKMFGHLLITSVTDEAVKPLFNRFAARLTSQQELIRKNRQEVTVDRISIGILNGCMIPAFLVMNRIIPESHAFFTTTPSGKGIVVFCLLSATVGIVLDLFATRSATYD